MSKLKGRIGESCERVGEGLGKVCGRDLRANLVRFGRVTVREGRVRNEMRSMTNGPGIWRWIYTGLAVRLKLPME